MNTVIYSLREQIMFEYVTHLRSWHSVIKQLSDPYHTSAMFNPYSDPCS